MRSLLGPDPIAGARFYGIGNELKSALAVMALAGVAAALYPVSRSRRAAGVTLLAGAAVAIIEGAARIGAGVGGAMLVAVAFATAAVMLLPGALTRRRALVVLISPLLALVLLAAVDLATAHGTGHFTGSVLTPARRASCATQSCAGSPTPGTASAPAVGYRAPWRLPSRPSPSGVSRSCLARSAGTRVGEPR